MSRVFWYFQYLCYCYVIHLNYIGCERNVTAAVYYGEQNRSSVASFSESNSRQRKWITQLMEEAKNTFQINPAANKKCLRDFGMFQLHLQNQSIWAVRMFESSEWPSVGLFAAMTYSMGNWDECMRVSEYGIKGQYCMVNAIYDMQEKSGKVSEFEWPNERDSVWNALEKYKTMPWLVQRQNLHWALCVPASCRPSEIAVSLNRTLHPIFHDQRMSIKVNVEADLCSRRNENQKFTLGFYVFCALAGTIIFLVIASTVWDHMTEDQINRDSNHVTIDFFTIVKSFSILQNMKILTKLSSESAIVHFIRILYMIFIALGHRIAVGFGFPLFNGEKIELTSFGRDDFAFVFRALFLTDVFSVLSGFLNYYHGSSKVKKNGFFFIIISLITRWMRLVPIFAFVLLFVINLLPHLSEGPFWNSRIGAEVESCSATFWYFLFGVNNIFETNKMCLYTSWYVAVDLQTAIIGDILLYVLSKKKSIGIFMVALLFIGSAVTSSIVLYVNKFHTLVQINDRVLSKPREVEEFTNFYVKTYYRLPLFLLGFVSAAVAKNERIRQIKITSLKVSLMILFIILVKSGVMLYTTQFFEFVEPYDRMKSAVNAVLPRLVFFIPDCLVLIVCFMSEAGFVSRYLNHHIFTIMGRLVYCFFVVHIVLIVYHVASFQVLMPTFANLSTIWFLGGDILYSAVATLILHLLVEAPIMNFVKIGVGMIFRKSDRKDDTIKPQNTGILSMVERKCSHCPSTNDESAK